MSKTHAEVKANPFLYNAGTELNALTALYETPLRGYDPAIGRFGGVDVYAAGYSSLTPYQYGANDPVYFNDPTGAVLGDLYGQEYDDENGMLRHLDGPQGGRGPYGGYGVGSGNHWSNRYIPQGWGQGGGNWKFKVGNLSINYGSLSNGVHHFNFSNGQVSNYGWSPDMNTPLMSATEADHYRTLTSLGLNVSLTNGRSLAQHNENGDFVQIDNGKVYVPYTDVSYWDYLRSGNLRDQSSGGIGDWVSGGMLATNTAVGAVSTYTVGSGKYYKWNEVWHKYKTSSAGTAWRWQKRWDNFGARATRAKQVQTVAGARALNGVLTKVGGGLLVADIALSGELKPSHAINALMLGASTTGVGAIAAGAWFLADFGTMGVNYLMNGEATGLGDMIDQYVGTYEMYDGLY